MLSSVIIERGACYVFFAYDLALAIDLDSAARCLDTTVQREMLKREHPAPSYFEYRPAPVRVTQRVESLSLDDYHTETTVDLVLYDFGAVSVMYTIPLAGAFSGLLALSESLYDNALLLADSRRRVEQLAGTIAPALTKGRLAEVVEDYAIFQINAFSPPRSPEELCTAHAQTIAQILRAERQTLSHQEVHDALSQRMSFGISDIIVVDWHAALVVDSSGDDVRAVLEFANVELLEMRYLDQRLDDALDRSYAASSAEQSQGLQRFFGGQGEELRYIARLQADSAILFEGVNNALKLLGDQYLARVYRLVSARFHLSEWDASILRKIQTLESIYQKMSDEAVNRRMELLEWIIILLIAGEILLSFFPHLRP